MAILICGNCGNLRETPNKYANKKVKCPACQKGTQVQETVTFLKLCLEEISQLQTEITELKRHVRSVSGHLDPAQKGYAFAHLASSPLLTQFDGVIQWFKAKQIQVEYDEKDMDISGFFDEIAVSLGDHYEILKGLYEKIKWAQTKGYYAKLNFDFASYDQKDLPIIKQFCHQLYENAFITRYTNDKTNKRLYLSLQTEPRIINFFNGEWLEWFAFMKVTSWLVEKQRPFSCLRSFKIRFPNQDQQEIDLFFLINQTIPLWIECKAGEFRPFIKKYTELRKRLKIDKRHSLLLALGVPDDKLLGFTNMFDLTIVNERNFLNYLSENLSPIST